MKARRITLLLFILVTIIFLLNTGISRSIKNWYAYSKINFIEQKLDLAISNSMNIENLKVNKELISGDGKDNDPSVTLNLNEDYMHSLNLHIKVGEADSLQLFYLNEDDQGFNEIKSLKYSLSPGDNSVELQIPYGDSSKKMTSIRIDPVQTNQHFIISDVYINK
ncbi:MAG: hypothetical protein K6T94_02885 [Paenibacillus sp.]|nr:hypothetical protein [Paenibacillus sp.]